MCHIYPSVRHNSFDIHGVGSMVLYNIRDTSFIKESILASGLERKYTRFLLYMAKSQNKSYPPPGYQIIICMFYSIIIFTLLCYPSFEVVRCQVRDLYVNISNWYLCVTSLLNWFSALKKLYDLIRNTLFSQISTQTLPKSNLHPGLQSPNQLT